MGKHAWCGLLIGLCLLMSLQLTGQVTRHSCRQERNSMLMFVESLHHIAAFVGDC